jgi:hypothetical protein
MGQYQQWLRYQKIDQSLHTTREALEAELAQCEGQLDLVILEQLPHEAQNSSEPSSADSLAYNPILSALFACLPVGEGEQMQTYIEHASYSSNELEASTSSSDVASPAHAYWDESLSEELNDYFDAHTLTDPQLELPWWLRKITDAQPGSEVVSMTDSGSARTNRLVQRWIDRWGRQATYQESFKEEGEGRSHAS